MEQPIQLKTGTTTVSLKYKNGVLLFADKRASAGGMIVDKKAKKIHKITKYIAVTTAGVVSDIQLLMKVVRAELKLKEVRTNKGSKVKEAANLLASMLYSSIRRLSTLPSIAHFIMGGYEKSSDKFMIYDLFPDGSITKVEEYICSGSGSVFAYGVLEANYKKDLGYNDALLLGTKAINAAMQRDIASGNGIAAMVITKEGCKEISEEELNRILGKKK